MVLKGFLKASAVAWLAINLAGCCCGTLSDFEPASGGGPPLEEPEDPLTPGEAGDDDTLSERGNREVSSFRRAKTHVDEIYAGQEVTFYCGCEYAKDTVQLSTCGYKPRKNSKRAKRLEIEHIVPAQVFGESTRAWREGNPECLDSKKAPYEGRRCAEKMSAAFRYMEADLYNLRPAIGEVNGDRSNYPPTIIEGEAREYGQCDVEIADQQFEPPPHVRGDIARTYFYMDWAYPNRGILTAESRAMFEQWDKEDPADDAERAWAAKVAQVQGNKNPFIK